MTGIQTLTSSYFDGSTIAWRDNSDASVGSPLFDEMLDTVSAHVDERGAEPAEDEYRDSDEPSDNDDDRDREADRDDRDDSSQSSGSRDHAEANTLAIPFDASRTGTAPSVDKAGRSALAGVTFTQPDTAMKLRFDAPAEMNAPGPRLTLDAQISQERAGVTSRPHNTMFSGLLATGTEKLEALRTGAQDAATQKFAAGEAAAERLATRKAEPGTDATAQSEPGAARSRATFAERMSDLADRLAQRLPGPETAPRQARPVAVALPTAASATQAVQSPARAGDLLLSLSATDAADEAAQLAAQSANRVVQTAQAATTQAAARAPQSAAGSPAEQISVQIQTGLRNDGDRINVRLYPAALGKVEVKLELSPDKTVQAIVTAEKPETLDMLARDARVLQRALEDAGFQTDSNSLSFRHDGDGTDARQFAENSQRTPLSFGDPQSDDTLTGEADQEMTEVSRLSTHDGVLDVEI